MKRTVLIILGLLTAFMLSATSVAADAPVITLQPQNPRYPEYSVAIYTVEAEGDNLTCTWYMDYEGKTYNISDNRNPAEPWEGYAGSSYGGSGSGNAFHYFFNGIESGLNGAEVYCVISNGSHSVTSDKAIITVMGSEMPPQIISVPSKVTARLGEEVDIRCIATSPGTEQLTYIWYETSTGKLPNIMAISPEPEYSDYLACDTSAPGTRYYVCGVMTSAGGMAYSSVIPVTVTTRIPAIKAPQIITANLPDATAGEKYSVQLECSDANAEFDVVSSSEGKNDFDKTGLKISKGGKITGTPSKAGEYTFVISASASGAKSSMTYTLSVKEALEPITSIAITDIEAPIAGKSPDCFASVIGKGYSLQKTNSPTSFNGIMWYDITDGKYIPLASKFAVGHEYQVYVELITEGNYIFSHPDGTINGQAAEVFGNTGATTVCFIFPPCKALGLSSSKLPTKSEQAVPSSQESVSAIPPKSKSDSALPVSQVSPSDVSSKSETSSAASETATVSASSAENQNTAVSSSSAAQEKVPVSAPSAESNSGMPMWGVVLCTVSAAVAGMGITLAVVFMKKSKK